MEFLVFIVLGLLVLGAMGAYYASLPDDKLNANLYGPLNKAIVCAQCGQNGKVHTKLIKKKSGISGGKATAALLTGGVSLLATGLSQKEAMTEAHCCHCDSTWRF